MCSVSFSAVKERGETVYIRQTFVWECMRRAGILYQFEMVEIVEKRAEKSAESLGPGYCKDLGTESRWKPCKTRLECFEDLFGLEWKL